ncbi:MAG: hypothetical protein A3F41_06610 [Coxiella sp. RIFCSPHIGHO2_12_FULL_44_14]|nr:MAG: hypothetical protein A3F41_06610 [Coxiella sp. RIFCSPHIGHO2_12_FULL_44_14]
MNKTILIIAVLSMLALLSTTAESSPSISPTASSGAVSVSSHSRTPATGPADINTADEQTLTSLKGVGVKKAQALIAYRQIHGSYKSLNDLTQVKGWGKKSLRRIMDNNPGRLRVGHPDSSR